MDTTRIDVASCFLSNWKVPYSCSSECREGFAFGRSVHVWAHHCTRKCLDSSRTGIRIRLKFAKGKPSHRYRCLSRKPCSLDMWLLCLFAGTWESTLGCIFNGAVCRSLDTDWHSQQHSRRSNTQNSPLMCLTTPRAVYQVYKRAASREEAWIFGRGWSWSLIRRWQIVAEAPRASPVWTKFTLYSPPLNNRSKTQLIN